MKDYLSKGLTGVEEGAESLWDMAKNSPEFAAGLYHTLRDHPSIAIKELAEGALRDIAQTGIGAAKFVAGFTADPRSPEAQKHEYPRASLLEISSEKPQRHVVLSSSPGPAEC